MTAFIESSAYHISVSLPNAVAYHDQEDVENDFKYGSRVENVDDQFQHKLKGPDDVTYGCYGHIDPDGGRQVVFYVADRLGFRPVVTDQSITVYPATSETSADSGISDGNQIEWKNLPFPTACLSSDLSGSTSASQRGLAGPRDDGSDTAESRDEFQRTVLAEHWKPSSSVAYETPAGDSQQPPFDDQTVPTEHRRESWTLRSNNNGVINRYSGAADNQPRPSDKGQPPRSAEQGTASDSWQPFIGGSDSFMLSSRCENGATPGVQTLTLHIPFHLSCSDMQEFGEEVEKLQEKFKPA